MPPGGTVTLSRDDVLARPSGSGTFAEPSIRPIFLTSPQCFRPTQTWTFGAGGHRYHHCRCLSSGSGPGQQLLQGFHSKTTQVLRRAAIPVRQRPDQVQKYLLVLFSADAAAHWDFADAASKAYVDWLHHCGTEDYQANVRLNGSRGVLSLFEESPPRLEDVEVRLQGQAEEYLPRQLSDLLQSRDSIRPVQVIEEVYGEMRGRARVTHVRAAFKALHAMGRTDDDGVGDFWLRPPRGCSGSGASRAFSLLSLRRLTAEASRYASVRDTRS
jgi:hypothetical protein